MNLDLINIKGTIITNNFENIDFLKLRVGQQILILNEKEYNNYDNIISYNDLKIYFLNSILLDTMYHFNLIESNLFINENYFYDNSLRMECNNTESELSYLKIHDSFLKIKHFEEFSDIENFSEFTSNIDFENFKSLNNDLESYASSYGKDSRIFRIFNSTSTQQETITLDNIDENHEKNIINKYFLLDLGTSKLGIKIKHNFCKTLYKWTKSISFYLFDNEFKIFSIIDIDNIPELIKIIGNEFWNLYNEDCIKNLNVYISKLSDIRKDFEIRENIYKYLKFNNNPTFIYEMIVKLIQPIYSDEENGYKAYLNDAITPLSFDFEYDINSSKTDKFKIKSIAVSNYLTRYDDIIDIYSGKVINKNYTVKYSDCEYILITNIDHDLNKIVFQKVDEMFIRVESHNKRKIIKTIEERMNVLNALTK